MARAAKTAPKHDDEAPKEATDKALFVNNLTKEHAVAFRLANGLVAMVPVTLRDDAHIEENFTEVTE